MRRILIISAIVLAALVALVLVLPFVIPVDAYRSRIEDEATAATGRQLRIEGNLRLTIFPELGITAKKVTLANIPGGHAPYFATMESLRVGVRLIPLLSRRIEISEVTLTRPEINLEAAKDGSGNWVLGAKGERGETSPESGISEAAGATFQGLRIQDGRVSYRDDATGRTRTLTAIDLTVGITSLAEPVSVDGSLVADGQTISLDGRIASLQALMSGAPTPADLSLTSNLVQASFKGDLARDSAQGTLKLDTPSLRKLAGWAGKPLPPGGGLGHLSLEGTLSAKGKTDRFSAIRLVLDKMTLTGALTAERAGKVPFVSGTLAVDALDLNPYLAAGHAGGDAAKPAPSGRGWSTTPLDLSVLNLIDAKLALSAGALAVRDLKAGKTSVTMTLTGGLLKASLAMGALYGGSGNADISVDARGSVPRIANSARFDNLAIKPFLTDTLGIDRIEGTGALSMDVNASGRSPNAIMHALAGKGAIVFKNGRIRGVDLASVARTIQSAVTGAATSSSSATDFTEMGGSFGVANGVMTNKDFHLLGPFIRMTGAGNINLGEQTIDFVVSPKAVASIEGQGGKTGLGGIGIPFRIHGPWSHISYSPDLSGVATDILQSIKKGGISTKSVLEGLLGGTKTDQTKQNAQPQQNGGKTTDQKKPSPLDALKGLFGPH